MHNNDKELIRLMRIGLLAILMLPLPVLAQNVTGTILGTLTDTSGAAVTQAQVSVVNQATGVKYGAVVGVSGEYTVVNLPSGKYTVNTTLNGFKPSTVKDVTVLVNRSTRVDVVLEPGALQQTVEVTATAPVVNSENATVGNIMQSGQITSVPLNGRTVDRLLRIAAGVSTDSANNPRVAGSPYWGGIEFNVDGVGYNDSGNGGGVYSYKHGLSTQPSVDTIQEFKIDSSSMKAESESGVSVTITTKSGTNEIHGSAWWFNRNREYAARPTYSSSNTPFNRNELGFTAGGPIIKNKLFLFGSFEDLLERSSLTTSALSVPTSPMKTGDFTGLATIKDPLSGSAFPDNKIPASRIDSRASTLQAYYPSPNTAGATNGTLQNYIGNIGNKYNVYRLNTRGDYHLSNKDTLFVNFIYSKGDPYFVARSYPVGYGSWESAGYTTKSINGTYMRTFTPTIFNELRFGFLSHTSVRQGQNKTFNPRSLFPDLYEVDYGGLPFIDLSTYAAVGDYGGAKAPPRLTPQYADNLTMIRGKHTVKMGLDIANNRVVSNPTVAGMGSNLLNNAGLGRFSFNGRYTTATSTAAPANVYADFLLGYANRTYRSTSNPAMVFSSQRYSFYVQDDIQVSRRLSLSAGLRYMVQVPWGERSGIMSQFDPSTGKVYVLGDGYPAAAQSKLINAYPVMLGSSIGKASYFETDKNNWSPRLGLAFRPFHDNKTVFRAGFGVYYASLPVFIGYQQLGFSNPPFTLAESYEAASGATPTLTLANPFATSGTVTANPSITGVQSNIKNAESYQWNFTFEREVARNTGVRASYVGNHSTHVPWYNYEINVSKEQIAGTLQTYRPYQPWGSILMLAGGGNSIMHQMQLEAIKRFTQGLSFQLEYAWTRSLDDVAVSGGPQDSYNARGDRGNSDQMRRHVFSAAYNYELPIGRGKTVFPNAGRMLDAAVGGWSLGGITYFRTGAPFSLSYTATQTGWRGGRPNAVCDGTLHGEDRGKDKWFDASCYTVPAPFTYGNMARNSLFAPGDIVFDISVMKDFRIVERVKSQFRAEFFNFPNHVNLGSPATNISVASTVGKITSTSTDARQIQFGLKFLF